MKNLIHAFTAFLIFINFFTNQTHAQTFKIINEAHDDGDFIVLSRIQIADLKYGQSIKVETLCPNQGKKIEVLRGKNATNLDNSQTFGPKKLGKECELSIVLSSEGDDWNKNDYVQWLVKIYAGDTDTTITGAYNWYEVPTEINVKQPFLKEAWDWNKNIVFPGTHKGDPWVNTEIEFERSIRMDSLLTFYGLIRGLVEPQWEDYKWSTSNFGCGSWGEGFHVGFPGLCFAEIKKYKKTYQGAKKNGLTTKDMDARFEKLDEWVRSFERLEKDVLAGGGWLKISRMNGEGKKYLYEYEFSEVKLKK